MTTFTVALTVVVGMVGQPTQTIRHEVSIPGVEAFHTAPAICARAKEIVAPTIEQLQQRQLVRTKQMQRAGTRPVAKYASIVGCELLGRV